MIDLPTEENPVTVIEGDCLDVLRALPDGCVDAVVTSPPYNQLHGSGISGGGMMKRNGFCEVARNIGYRQKTVE